MKTKKITLHAISALVVTAFLFFAVASSDDSSAEKKITAEETASAVKISSRQLYSDYESNEVAADEKYKGKVLIVTGTIESIGKDITDNIYVTLKGDGFFGDVQCFFSDDHIKETAQLRKGQRITIKGRCQGKMMGVLLRGSSVVEE